MEPTREGQEGAVRSWPWTIVAGILALGLLLVTALGGACQERQRAGRPDLPRPGPVARPAPAVLPAPIPTAPPPTRPRVASIVGEPQLLVLIQRGGQADVQLLRPGRDDAGRDWPAGTVGLRCSGGRLLAGGRDLGSGPCRIACPGAGAGFSVGERRFAGELVLRCVDGVAVVCEGLAMEPYLIGVLSKEVEPDWPLEALKAQAVAARSYATARWMVRHEAPWQLDASEQVDMAYAGHVAQVHPHLAAAVAQTRGDLLWFAGQPLPAFFHAASGGHTEAVVAIWPDRRTPDGSRDLAAAMPGEADPWDAPGRAVAPKRLGPWRAVIPLADLREQLVAAGHRDPGTIAEVRLTARDAASGRARQLRVSGRAGRLDLSAHQLRMAVGSMRIRSTLWRDFRLEGGQLIVQGHGFGHGVGLPQASAWAMAHAGHAAPQILLTYYPGATLVRKW